jgi:predicted ATPase
LAEQRQEEEGVAQIRRGLTAYGATGAVLSQPHFLALLAEVYVRGGQIEEGLTVINQALMVVQETGECYYEAELYRLKGELTLQKGASDWVLATGATSPRALSFQSQDPKEVEREADVCFLKAIEVAQKQQAKSLELRATVSLARLWQQRGKQQEAYATLSEIYTWFTEGFDTKDLQEAKALLEELNQ